MTTCSTKALVAPSTTLPAPPLLPGNYLKKIEIPHHPFVPNIFVHFDGVYLNLQGVPQVLQGCLQIGAQLRGTDGTIAPAGPVGSGFTYLPNFCVCVFLV